MVVAYMWLIFSFIGFLALLGSILPKRKVCSVREGFKGGNHFSLNLSFEAEKSYKPS